MHPKDLSTQQMDMRKKLIQTGELQSGRQKYWNMIKYHWHPVKGDDHLVLILLKRLLKVPFAVIINGIVLALLTALLAVFAVAAIPLSIIYLNPAKAWRRVTSGLSAWITNRLIIPAVFMSRKTTFNEIKGNNVEAKKTEDGLSYLKSLHIDDKKPIHIEFLGNAAMIGVIDRDDKALKNLDKLFDQKNTYIFNHPGVGKGEKRMTSLKALRPIIERLANRLHDEYPSATFHVEGKSLGGLAAAMLAGYLTDNGHTVKVLTDRSLVTVSDVVPGTLGVGHSIPGFMKYPYRWFMRAMGLHLDVTKDWKKVPLHAKHALTIQKKSLNEDWRHDEVIGYYGARQALKSERAPIVQKCQDILQSSKEEALCQSAKLVLEFYESEKLRVNGTTWTLSGMSPQTLFYESHNDLSHASSLDEMLSFSQSQWKDGVEMKEDFFMMRDDGEQDEIKEAFDAVLKASLKTKHN